MSAQDGHDPLIYPRFSGRFCEKCGIELVRRTRANGRHESPGEYAKRKWCTSALCGHRHHDGRRKHPLFSIWNGIMHRCYQPTNHAYDNYGGRGIYVAPEWLDFWTFANDMTPRPAGASIDRINNDGPYAKWNCRWSDHKQQTRNSRLNKHNMLPPEAPALSEYATRLGITRQGAWHRIRRFGWKATWEGAGASPRHPFPPSFLGQS